MSYASAGIGTQHHVNAELLKTLTGIEMTHVPYRGGGPALQDVVAGHVPIYFGDVSTVMPLARAGKVRALALTISQRLDAFPEVPTMHEAGITNYNASAWQAFVAPAGTPAAIVARLNQALLEVVEVAGDAEALPRARLAAADQHAGRARRLHEERAGALGQGGGSRRRQGNRVKR